MKFHFFTGKLKAGEKPDPNPLLGLPAPPRWRQFGASPEAHELDPFAIQSWDGTERERDLAEAYQFGNNMDIVSAINAALLLRRPLLITGPAGSGKSSLIYAVARELRLGPVLTWNITSRSTLKEGEYDYEALGRLQEIQARERSKDVLAAVKVEDFVRLGPLGTAFAASGWPRALLIDEIDKADLDLPNDLLNLFEEGRFSIEELRRAGAAEDQVEVKTWKGLYGPASIRGGQVTCSIFPFIVLTSNGEREFSAPFLRRCVRLEIGAPNTSAELAEIVRAHLRDSKIDIDAEASNFLKLRQENRLSTDQLMNAIFILDQCTFKEDGAKKSLLNALYKSLS